MRGHFRLFMVSVASLMMCVSAADAGGGTIRIAVVQTVVVDSLEVNRDRIIRFIREADDAGCQLVVFSENELHWDGSGYVEPEDVPQDRPSKRAMDAAIGVIRRAIREAGIVVIFGADSRHTEGGRFSGRAYAFGPDGEPLAAYWKDKEVPPPFDVAGVRCNFMICSDRGYLEHSDLPCLVEGARVILDTSGGHGGDDGRPGLRRIRYRPWAQRTGAYVIVSNPVHEDIDFMGHSPWGGGSAVIRPDGSIAAGLTYEKDEMIVVDVDVDQTAPQPAQRRREHPLFREFWDTGERLLKGEPIGAVPDHEPYKSAQRDIKIAAAQFAATSDVTENTRRILTAITEAAGEAADIVVFPELAVTGSGDDNVLRAEPSALEEALRQIRQAARANRIYVIAGMPHAIDGALRNSAFVIADDGSVLTRYDQLASSRNNLFEPGTSAKAMWFTLKGVHSIVTIGDDANWVEIGDLAAARGMCLRFHISAAANDSSEAALIRRQRDLLALSSAQFGAAVNAHGGSLIASREGGHRKPAPAGVEHYLPYQTSIVCSAGSEETILYATRRTSAFNSQDLNHYWRNRQRKSRDQTGWYDWIKAGAWLIATDDPGEAIALEVGSTRTSETPEESAESGPSDGTTFKGRIAYSADGNFNDPDDWASSAIALAVLSHTGRQNRLVHFDYNCILPRNDPHWEKTHTESVLGAAERYGYERSIFHDCQKDLDGALASIAAAINASSADDPLYFILAGPMEVPFLGIEKSDPDKRQFVYCISHSRWNDGFSAKARHDFFTYNKRSVIGTGINWVQVPSQNLLATSPYGREARPEEWAPFHWMRDAEDARLRFLWERLKVSTRPDCSDSGMAYFVATGDPLPDPDKYRRLMADGHRPAPAAARAEIRLEAEDFPHLDGYQLEDRNDRSASHRLNVRATGERSSGRIGTRFNQPYAAARGRYDVDVRYLDEQGQPCRLALLVNGTRQGELLKSPGNGQGWSTHTFAGVDIAAGDEIVIEADGTPPRLDYVQLNRQRSDTADANGSGTAHPRFTATGPLDDPAALPGQIIVAGGKPGYLKYNGGGIAFLCGPDNPEDFLFMGTLEEDGTRSGGEQEQIIQRLTEAGVNAFHCQMTRLRRCNIKDEGDDQHCPFVDFDPSKPLNEAVLDQWDGWISQLERAGIVLHLEFYNDATDIEQMGWTLDENGELHPDERRFFEGIVERFKHHKNIIWGIEESLNKLPRARTPHFKKLSELIVRVDNHNHPIVHSFVTPETAERDRHPDGVMSEDYRDDPHIDIVTWLHVPPHGDDFDAQHQAYLKYAARDRDRFIAMKNETEYHRVDRTTARRQIWACALTGMHALEAQHNAARRDRHDRLVDDGKVVTFMEQTDFHRMQPRDDLAAGATKWVLANPGESYIAYTYSGSGPMGVKEVSAGTYDLLWFDTVDGDQATQSGVSITDGQSTWSRPESIGEETALYLRRQR